MENTFTDRRVLRIALPIMLSNATIPILGTVDTAVVGQIGLAAPIGAVGLGALILTVIYGIFAFLRMGTAGLAAQAVGAKDQGELSALLSRSLMIGIGAGLVLIIAQYWLFKAALALAPASFEVERLTQTYLTIRIYGAPATIALYGITGWLIAQERTRAVFVIQVAMNLLNIALDILFVIKFDMGIAGVARATLIAEYSGLLIGLIAVRHGFQTPAWRDPVIVFAKNRWARMMSVNRDIMIRSILLLVAFVLFLFESAKLGDVSLAANQVLLQFLYICAFSMDGFAFAAETLVGQAVAQNNRRALRKASYLSGKWMLVMALALAMCFAILGPWIITQMTTNLEVQATAGQYLGWMVATPILGLASFLLDGVFIGATRAKIMRDMMFVSLVMYIGALKLLPAWGNHGLWAAMCILLIARGITLAIHYPALERSQKA